ncbi:MAG: hypothetical protein QM674_16285 [Burkholderiaceae bacterium]
MFILASAQVLPIVPLPNMQACEQILNDCLLGLGRTFSGIDPMRMPLSSIKGRGHRWHPFIA